MPQSAIKPKDGSNIRGNRQPKENRRQAPDPFNFPLPPIVTHHDKGLEEKAASAQLWDMMEKQRHYLKKAFLM